MVNLTLTQSPQKGCEKHEGNPKVDLDVEATIADEEIEGGLGYERGCTKS